MTSTAQQRSAPCVPARRTKRFDLSFVNGIMRGT
jgi:hypothetical protein